MKIIFRNHSKTRSGKKLVWISLKFGLFKNAIIFIIRGPDPFVGIGIGSKVYSTRRETRAESNCGEKFSPTLAGLARQDHVCQAFLTYWWIVIETSRRNLHAQIVSYLSEQRGVGRVVRRGKNASRLMRESLLLRKRSKGISAEQWSGVPSFSLSW